MEQQNNTQANPVQGAEDIVARVSKPASSPDQIKQAEPVNQVDSKLKDLEVKVNEAFIKPEELAAIKDPVARQFLQRKEKEMLSGLNKKFQEVAELRKSLEASNQQPSKQIVTAPDITTKEGLMKALQDPKFTTIVQELAQENAPQDWQGSNEEWSALNDSEKAEFKALKSQIQGLTGMMNTIELEKIDNRIKSKYADYDSTHINSLEDRLRMGEVNDEERRELIYKAINYEKAIKRAYEIAKEELSGNIRDKVNASSIDGLPNSQTESGALPERGNKSSSQYFLEIAKRKLAESKNIRSK